MKNQITIAIGILTLIGMSFGGYFYIDERYAYAKDHEELKQKVETMQVQSTYRDALDEMYYYRRQNRKYPQDNEVGDKLKESEGEVKDLKVRLKELEDD